MGCYTSSLNVSNRLLCYFYLMGGGENGSEDAVLDR
jgi:hypothetical protein